MPTLLAHVLEPLFGRSRPYQSLLRFLAEAERRSTYPIRVRGLESSAAAVALFFLRRSLGLPLLVVTPTEVEAQAFARDWEALGEEIPFFPGWGGLAYQDVAPHPRVFGQRARALAELSAGARVVVAPLRGLLSRLPPPPAFRQLCLKIDTGQVLDPVRVAQELARSGYERSPRASVPGEFALRGEVLDIFPAGYDEAVRVVFEFDRVLELRFYDPLTQSGGGAVPSVLIPPMREVIFHGEQALTLAPRLEEAAAADLLETARFRGEELFFAPQSPYWLASYFTEEPLVVWLGREKIETQESGFFKELEQGWEVAQQEGRPRPRPEEVYFHLAELRPARQLLSTQVEGGDVEWRAYPRSWGGEANRFLEDARAYLDQGGTVYVFAGSEQQAVRLKQLFRDDRIAVFDPGLSAGFELEDVRLLCVRESEIFGRRRRRLESLRQVHSRAIDSFVDLSPGDYVVHVNYGIGRFLGIDRMRVGGMERDYIKLEYAGEELIFIPIEQVNLIQRYIGSEGKEPSLDRIGGKSWERKKQRVKKAVEDLAERLITLYARRRSATGYAFPPDNEWQLAFEADFPYEETEDQLRAIAEIKADMESPRPMDRLLCGDVGFGKTEVALRAAFKAVMGGRQVAFLAPTTILAEQHYETCLERFSRFPVRVRMLSRFVDRSDQKKILEEIAAGKVDVVVGTHRLLQKDVRFKNLGLLIVDEEQRFGVKDKERLKELKATIDCLSMSATPIPRTLHMSLLRIRDMSLLRTPPRNRQPIETFIQEFDPEVVKKAIRRELDRGGQVFYLHNRVEGLEEVCGFLRSLLPDVLIDMAHGQMAPHELEDVMHRFIHGAFQVLVSTTIIENGIDIPNVNTIIIDRADMYGISQLYQLRGRVGRSGRVAYAYLLYPQRLALSELAMKRLQVIGDFTELGSGFKIAMKDLEVRGAGNLLGAEQSGEIASVGFDMYLRLLDEAVAERLGEVGKDRIETVLELEYSGFIPDSYIAEPMEKMEVYKAIAGVTEEEDLDRVRDFIEDRYGPMPPAVQNLLALAELRLLASQLRIVSLKEKNGWCRLDFASPEDLPFDRAMRLIQRNPEGVRAVPEAPASLLIRTEGTDLGAKPRYLRVLLGELVHG